MHVLRKTGGGIGGKGMERVRRVVLGRQNPRFTRASTEQRERQEKDGETGNEFTVP